MTAGPAHPYFLAGPWPEVTYLDAEEFPTVVNVAHDHPMAEMAPLFDETFGALFPALGTQGLRPIGPPFSLHHRMPTETVDFEVGIPVDRPLGEAQATTSGVTLTPSVLPAGRIAVVSHLGSYDGLGEAWGRFMNEIATAGHQPDFPFWEVYVTEPTPDVDPATLRTDLVVRLREH
ncbi:GyrI-like domain-containing protein [Granulicoccus sp. GXG6511]|uniref:GyrI-like domain-containing protein n=1 Tax=Granulicoccus sp. GXG6511 TaxID=3381351 RepID=UPI003D7C7F5B